MLTVEQVRNLDEKVRSALELIDSLKSENNMLKVKLDEYKQRNAHLSSIVDGYKHEQLEIEEGIKDVLRQLDQLEDQITSAEPAPRVEPSGVTEQKAVPAEEHPEPSPYQAQAPVQKQSPELEIF